MAYISMKKLITNQNNKYNARMVTTEDYNAWKEVTQNKLDVFLTCNRLSAAQYEELTGMLLIV